MYRHPENKKGVDRDLHLALGPFKRLVEYIPARRDVNIE